jgi:AcrR family transcriptional regulator
VTDQSVSRGKRDAILDAARAAFSRNGYERASVEDIAVQAGIAKGTLYLYFKSKEELYLAALTRDLRALADKGRAGMEKAATLRGKMLAFLQVRLEYARSHEEFLRIYLAEYGSLFVKPGLQGELRRLARANLRYVAKVVEEAAARREIPPVPAGAVAMALFAISRGLIEARILGWKELQASDDAGFAVDLLWRGIGGSAKARRRS